MKKMFLGLIISAILSVNAIALDFSTNFAAGTFCLLTNPVRVSSITLYSVGSATTLGVFDNNEATSTYTNAAYITYASYVTNLVWNVTNTWGTIVTNTNSVVWTYPTIVGANTNNLTPAGTFICPANQVITYPVLYRFVKGLTVTNSNTNVVIGFTYTSY